MVFYGGDKEWLDRGFLFLRKCLLFLKNIL